MYDLARATPSLVGWTGSRRVSCCITQPSKCSFSFQQFVWNDFSDEYNPTDRKHTFYPSVIINDHLYEVKISDIPVIPYFPVNSYYEWTDFRFYGLRNATAYILVFDLSNVETFQYVKTIRDQIYESRDMRNVPLLVVGNKQDLLCNNANTVGSSGSGSTGALQQLALPSTSGGGSSTLYAHDRDKKRDIVNLVKKHWKCGYVECSAKYNWRVVAVFKELMKTIDAMENSHPCKDRDASTPMMDNIHEALEGNRCVIF
jgi:Ras-like protein family member 10B